MSRKLTQEEAEKRSLDVGIRMSGTYLGSKTKAEFECPVCNDLFLCIPGDIWRRGTKTCCSNRLITQEKAKKKSLSVGFIMTGIYINNKTKTEFQCPYCNCLFLNTPHNIWIKNTKSCGHCNDPKIGDVFSNLKIIKIIKKQNRGGRGCSVEALCLCGKTWGGVFSALTRNGNKKIKSCGNCQLKRNGINTSWKALLVNDKVDTLINSVGLHNHTIPNGPCVDIYYEINNQKNLCGI